MPKLPAFDVHLRVNHSPHIVIVGAGASRAATPEGDAQGIKLPLMSDFVGTVGLERTLTDLGVAWKGRNFEDIYDELYQANPDSDMLRTLEASTAATSARDRLALWARVKSRRRERLHSMRPFEAR